MLYSVNEIFYSIQGEGYYAGSAAVFIRLAGCNLQCEWCDTNHEKKEEMTPASIVNSVIRLWPYHARPFIVITGGEPTIQDLTFLVTALKKECMYVAVETNGTGPIPMNVDWITVSPKEEHTPYIYNLKKADEIKVVLDGINDPENWNSYGRQKYIQPCSEKYGPAVEYVKTHPEWRLSIQIQKILEIR